MSLRLTLGLTESSPDASLETIGSCKGFESCLDKLPVRWGRPSLSCARTGPTRRRLTAFFPMSASTKEPFCLAIFKQRVIELQRLEDRFWFSTTRRNLPISEIGRTYDSRSLTQTSSLLFDMAY